MSRQRTLRRAAERAAAKSFTATAQAGHLSPNQTADVIQNASEPTADFTPASLLSEARWTANRANAQHSTGPITPEGRSISSMNALKHGLTGVTVLLDSDDADAYQAQLDAHVEQFRPLGYEERRLVQSMHDCAWRLDRILTLESTIYARGRLELEGTFPLQPLEHRKHYIEYEISQRHAKQLRNLHIQESRLQRQRAKDLKALKELQTERRAEEKAAAEAAALSEKQAAPHPAPGLGFVFANHETQPVPAFQPIHQVTNDSLDRSEN